MVKAKRLLKFAYFAGMKSIVTIFFFLLFFIAACSNKKTIPKNYLIAFKQIDSLKKMLRSGDLIFRNGNDEVSQAARSFNRKDTSYSHCGIVLIENDTPFVYHALGGSYNPSQKLMRQLIDSFSTPTENVAIGAYRYPLDTPQLNKLKNIVHTYHQQGLRFDLFFNYQSDDAMYCAEFVFKSLNKALDSRLTHFVRLDTIPFGVTTDDLFLNPNSQLIKRVSFNY
jgi:hypothetical protein